MDEARRRKKDTGKDRDARKKPEPDIDLAEFGGDADRENNVARAEGMLLQAEYELETTKREEKAYWEKHSTWDAEKGKGVPITPTRPFWKGTDWSPEEKKRLMVAEVALGAGFLQTLTKLAGAAVGVYAAAKNEEAAEARLASSNITDVNRPLQEAAEGALWQAILTLGDGAVEVLTMLVGGAKLYYDTWSEHVEKVKELNAPDVASRRERLEALVAELQMRLHEEIEKAKRAGTRPRHRRKAKATIAHSDSDSN